VKNEPDLFAPFAAKRGIADRYPELFFIPTFLWYTVPPIMGGKQKLALSDILKDDTEAERVFKIVCEQEEY
jgi:hypothetical protein